MENIKLESELRLENILVSLTVDTLNKLNDLLETREIDQQEKASITKFIYMTNQLNKIPNLEILKKEFPHLYFESIVVLQNEELDDYIRLYISNKKNTATSRKLLELANLVKTNGVTEEIVNRLNDIAKSDTVSIAHKDVGENILEMYKKKVELNGIKTGIPQIDNDIGGLQPRSFNNYIRFYWKF